MVAQVLHQYSNYEGSYIEWISNLVMVQVQRSPMFIHILTLANNNGARLRYPEA
jgi:hypothetical protein